MHHIMDTRPNILLIVTDQHHHAFLGYRGAHWLSTPNIDRIAKQGTVFTHCCVNSPVCGPSRTSLAAGKRPHRIGCLTNADTLPLSQRTFYQQLRDGNYWTGFTGKLDIAKNDIDFPGGSRHKRIDGQSPEHFAYGFCQPREIGGGMAGGANPNNLYGKHLHDHGWMDTWNEDRRTRNPEPGLTAVSNFSGGRLDLRTHPMPEGWVTQACRDSPLPKEAHIDHFCGECALDLIDQTVPGQPWFFQVNFLGPHDPFDPPTEYAERYRNADVPDPIPAEYAGKPEWVARRHMTDDVEQIKFSRRQYSACINMIDDKIGHMLDLLERKGQLDHTIIIFTADHGEMLGDMGLYIKHVGYDSSLRVPLAVCGPGIQQGVTTDALVEWVDLNPTICELAGVEPVQNIDGRSIAPILRGEANEHRNCCVFSEHNYHGLRTHDHKLIVNENDITEMYDLQADPQELNNIANNEFGKDGDKQIELTRMLKKQMSAGGWNR